MPFIDGHHISPVQSRVHVLQCLWPVPGGVSTVWQGSAIHCTGNRITLLHSQFVKGTSSGCPGGTVVAQSLYVDRLHNRYTSLLNITANSALNNETIECLYYNSTLIPVESYIITTVTGTKEWYLRYFLILFYYVDPITPPNGIHLLDASSGNLTFKWNPVTSPCHTPTYSLHTVNCGLCPKVTNNTVMTCTDAVIDGRVCTLSIQTFICGNITGNTSIPVNYKLKGESVHLVRLLRQVTS